MAFLELPIGAAGHKLSPNQPQPLACGAIAALRHGWAVHRCQIYIARTGLLVLIPVIEFNCARYIGLGEGECGFTSGGNIRRTCFPGDPFCCCQVVCGLACSRDVADRKSAV